MSDELLKVEIYQGKRTQVEGRMHHHYNGLFYGIAASGGDGYSVVYGIDTGLAPFVDTLPSSRKVGANVTDRGEA